MKIEKYLEIFAREAEEHLTTLRQGLMHLEKHGPSEEKVHELLRSAHTLKGSARLLGLGDLSQVSHKMEDRLKGLSRGKSVLTPEEIDLLLIATDGLEALIAQAHSGDEIEVSVDDLLLLLDGGKAELPRPKAPAPAAAEPKQAPETVIGDTVRTSVAKLDQITNLLGELLITRDMLGGHGQQMRQLLGRLDQFLGKLRRAENYRRLKEIFDDFTRLHFGLERDTLSLSYLAEEIHDQALTLRMLPLSVLLPDLERLARDLAREQGKSVEFEVSGGEVELDRMMIEAVKPMLLHMLRNAVDHGIEPPQERKRLGKPEAGSIRVAARYDRGGVRIGLTDDGRGIDPANIRKAAVDRRLLPAEEAAAMSDEEALYLILRPGFSTREIITDVSGRGVGMDVVKTNLDRVKGNLAIRSAPGKGAEMILELPLTMAIITGLVIGCASQTYAIPMHYLKEVLRLRRGDILLEGKREIIRLQDRSLPLLDLAHILGLATPEEDADERLTALVLRYGQEEVACLVSRSFGVQDLVVKGMGPQLKSVRFFSGATILGDGSPALILSIPDLFEASRERPQVQLSHRGPETEEASRGHVLVVDDSITTRTMEKNILETHGYRVRVAISGEEALERLDADIDLVVTDIEMPGMNGFELTRQIRQQEAFLDLPVVIVSSRSSDEDKRRGIEVGAQAYIVKSSFDQGTLLQTVETLIG